MNEVREAIAYAYRELKLVVEPGGAVGLAAVLSGKFDAKGKSGDHLTPAAISIHNFSEKLSKPY